MQMETSPTAPRKGIWGIIGDVFFSPVQAFEAFKQKPNLWVPLILVIVLAGAAGYFTADQAAKDQYEMLKTSTLPDAIKDQMRQDAQNPSKIGAAIGPGIAVPLIGIVSALLAWFFGGFLFGGKAKFVQIWGAGLLAGIIPVVGGLLRIPLAISKGTAQVSIGPAALLQQTDYISVMRFFLFFADVFAIWSLAVLSIGYSVIFGISRGKGAATAVLTWLIMTIVFVGFIVGSLSFTGVDIRFI